MVAYKRNMSPSQVPHDDLTASLAARRELGPDYDAAFAEAIAERVEAAMGTRKRVLTDSERGERAIAVTVACVSLGVSIPLTAIAVINAGLAGLVIVWLAITTINVAFALRPRRR